MENKKRTRFGNDERGVAMVLALMVLSLLTIMAMGALLTANRSLEIAGGVRHSTQAFYIAQAGINRSVLAMLWQYKYNQGFESDEVDFLGEEPYSVAITGPRGPDSEGGPTLAWDTTDMSDPQNPTLYEWRNAADVFTMDYALSEACMGDYDADTSTCNGFQYEVRIHKINEYSLRILSTAKRPDGHVDAAIEFVLEIETDSICNNALFSNGAASGRAINGNVKVHGGVHIMCGDTVPADCSAYPDECIAGEFGGNAGIYNNYDSQGGGGTPDFITDGKIDDLELDDEGNPTLKAKLLVQNCGIESLGGNFDVGTEDAPLDEVAIDGGVGAVYGDEDTNITDGFYTDEGAYGAGTYLAAVDNNPPIFPELLSDTSDLSSYITADPGSTLLADTMDIPDDSPLCNLAPTTDPAEQKVTRIPSTCTICEENCDICWDRTIDPPVLTTYTDKVYDLSGCTAPSMEDFEYIGKGTFYYGINEVHVDGTVSIVAGKTYPTDSAMAFMTAGDMIIGESAQSEIMGLFYAQGKTTISMQTAVAGIIMTNGFDIGNQVPEIYQVPNIDTQAPAGFREMCNPNEYIEDGGWRMVY